jgi:glutathione synthase/RimK-type ligase-like ATP-grasp enzyme
MAGAEDLPFAGIDLKITRSGVVYCFEVNPCPGFSYYQASTGQPIATAVSEYLAEREEVGSKPALSQSASLS